MCVCIVFFVGVSLNFSVYLHMVIQEEVYLLFIFFLLCRGKGGDMFVYGCCMDTCVHVFMEA